MLTDKVYKWICSVQDAATEYSEEVDTAASDPSKERTSVQDIAARHSKDASTDQPTATKEVRNIFFLNSNSLRMLILVLSDYQTETIVQ